MPFDPEQLRRDVKAGLIAAVKTLPPKYFYDERGSELFEAITRLPEYYLTRAERSILARVAPELASELAPRTLVELGAGSADKTRILLDALTAGGRDATYVPVDVSADFLARSAERLRTEYPRLTVIPVTADFSRDLPLPPLPAPVLCAFLGSTIGNFDEAGAARIVRGIAGRMTTSDALLLGVDLRKSPDMILRAYDDAGGVTAEFNRNVLRVINRVLGADFDPARFRHRVVYDDTRHRVEMHLDADGAQRVSIPGVGVIDFAAGESIHTEVSHKYDRPAVEALLGAAGLRLARWDTAGAGLFALATGRRGE